MKALFFLLDGDTNASSAYRVLQYLPALRAAGIEPLVSRPVPEPLYQRLVEHGRGRGSEKAAFYATFLACRWRDVLRAGRADVAVIQRDLFPFGPPVLERLLRRVQPRVVYDTADDAARDVAERLVGSVRGAFQRTTGLSGGQLARARLLGNDAGYIVALERQPLDPCRDARLLADAAPWLDLQTIVPLVETRLRAIVRNGRAGIVAEWDGGMHLAGGDAAR